MGYKAIGFDYGGVVAGRSAGVFVKGVSDYLGVSGQDFDNAYFKYNSLFNEGTISFKEFWGRVLRDLGKIDQLQKLIGYLKRLPPKEINWAVINLIKDLKKAGYKIGLLSNNSSQKGKQIRKMGLDKFFDVMLISEEVGISKPHPKSYKLFCDRLGVKPREMIFVDDTQYNLDILSELGIYSVLFTTLENLMKELVDLGVCNLGCGEGFES